MGTEFEPFELASLVLYLFWPAVLLAAAAMHAWRTRHEDVLPVALTAIAICFLVITLRTQRFIEYLVPFVVFALAVAWRPRSERRVAPFLVAVGISWIVLVAPEPLERLRARQDLLPPAVAAQLRATVPEGEQVVTCGWGHTGEMMLALPERKFVVALDPVFFSMKDDDLYRLWFRTMHAPPPSPAGLLRENFAARFVLCSRDREWEPIIDALIADPEAELRGVHGDWVVFELLSLDARK
jgi:hypothetical protein